MLGRGDQTERPVQSILVEPGPGLATAFLREDLVDRLLQERKAEINGAEAKLRALEGDEEKVRPTRPNT